MVLNPLRLALQRVVLAPWGKPLLWVLCAWPALALWSAALADQLGANPAEALIRGLGDWALRFLCLALAVTPLRVGLGVPALARWHTHLAYDMPSTQITSQLLMTPHDLCWRKVRNLLA